MRYFRVSQSAFSRDSDFSVRCSFSYVFYFRDTLPACCTCSAETFEESRLIFLCFFSRPKTTGPYRVSSKQNVELKFCCSVGRSVSCTSSSCAKSGTARTSSKPWRMCGAWRFSTVAFRERFTARYPGSSRIDASTGILTIFGWSVLADIDTDSKKRWLISSGRWDLQDTH